MFDSLDVLQLNFKDTQDEDPVPFSFHVSLPDDETKPGAPTRLVVSKSLETDVLAHSSGAFSQEDILVVHCSPQSVFRVRPATRCSSTLSGMHHLLCFFAIAMVIYLFIQDTRLQYFVHRFPPLVIFLLQDQETPLHVYGISTPRPHLTF